MSTIRSTALVTATPLVLAAAGMVHPGGLSRATATDWANLHIVLLPVFPLLPLGLLIVLWHRPHRDLPGLATVVAWIAAFTYAAFHTGLDAVAGPLYDTADVPASDCVREKPERLSTGWSDAGGCGAARLSMRFRNGTGRRPALPTQPTVAS
ncbi:hypothetical protein ACQPZP_25475 [Spirillospora sp. CA-142024]|uniref:hypothetical protein n=1 Tax=Spirillospora sp. CA-142024 TaxID=3240036 RepID=UPI003D91BBE9